MSGALVTLAAARTAVGDSAEQMAAAIRANVVRLREDAIYAAIPADPEGEREAVRAARVDGIDPALDGRDRLLALIEPVLGDLLDRAEHLRRDAHRAALLVALPASDAVTDTWDLDGFGAALTARLGLPFARVHAVRGGHAGALGLLGEAETAELTIVAGVDSYLTPARLALYDTAERLRTARNADGFFPGEAAAAVLIEGARRVEARGETACLRIAGIGAGREDEAVKSDKPSTGKGLTDAIRGALADGAMPGWAISDFNGESYRGYEWGVTYARLGDRLKALAAVSHPLRNTGDVGAATGAVQLALAAAAFRRGWAPAEDAILWAGSDGGERAAARVTRA